MQALMKQLNLQILVLVANIHLRIMNAEVEQSFMSTSVEHGLLDAKRNCTYFQRQLYCLIQKGIGLIFLKYFLWC